MLHLASNRQVVRVVTQQAPAAELGHKPHAVGQVRLVDCAACVEAQRVGILPGMAEAVLVLAEETRLNRRQRRIDILATTEQLRGAALVFFALIDKPTGFQHSHDQRTRAVGVLFSKLTGAAQNFLRVVRPDGLAGDKSATHLLIHGLSAPGFADAETIDAHGFKVGEHLRWRYDDAVHVAQWVNALAGQPVIQPHGVGAGGEGLGEGQFCARLVRALRQCAASAHTGGLQGGRQVDALAILVQAHQHGHIGGWCTAKTQLHAIDQAVEAMRCIEFAAQQFVAQRGPGSLALEVEGQPMLLGEALGGGDDDRCGVCEGHKADVQHRFFRWVAAADLVLIHGAFPVPTQKGSVPSTDFSQRSERHHCLFEPFPPLERLSGLSQSKAYASAGCGDADRTNPAVAGFGLVLAELV